MDKILIGWIIKMSRENFKPTFAWSIILTVMVSVLIASMNSWHT
jgi:hypothetical protein